MTEKVMAFCRKAWSWILGVGVLLLGAFGLWQLDRYRHRELGRLKDELAFAEAEKEIHALRKVREEVAKDVHEDDEAIQRIDEELVRNKRRLVESFEHGQGMSDEEVLREFTRLGI